MGNLTEKKQVQVYLVADLHRQLKVLAAERGVTISYLVELATRKLFEFDGLVAAEAPRPYGRTEEVEKSEATEKKEGKRPPRGRRKS